MDIPKKNFVPENQDSSGAPIELKTMFQQIMDRLDKLEQPQEALTGMLASNNVLLQRNFGLYGVQWHDKFPIKDSEDMHKMNDELRGEKRADIVMVMKRLLRGDLANLEAIFSKDIILQYNYDGIKGKNCLRDFTPLLEALFEASNSEAAPMPYNIFIKDLRNSLRLKNRVNKQQCRLKNSLNK